MTKRLYQQYEQRRGQRGGVVGLEPDDRKQAEPLISMKLAREAGASACPSPLRDNMTKGTVRMGPRKTSHQIQTA
mgnify:CR=1 FL=1